MMIHGIFNKKGYGKQYFMKKHNTSSEEIKEMLKILKKCEFGACITKHNSRVLLDYITNLQDQLQQASLDIQELTERDIWCPTSCDKLTNLQEENELYLRRSYEAYEIKEEYKSRNEKAIEYINKSDFIFDKQYEKHDKLLNILKGVNNEKTN